MSPIELTDEQRRQLEVVPGTPVDVVDPATNRAYVLLPREQYDRVRYLLASPPASNNAPESAEDLIPPGVLRSQQAFWRDLPELLRSPKNRGRWVCYRGDERLGIARTERELVRECLRRGLRDDEYYTDVIEPRTVAPWEVEEIEPGGHEVADEPVADRPGKPGEPA